MTTAARSDLSGWMERFHPFTLQHALVAGCLTTAIVAVALIGRRLRRAGPDGVSTEAGVRRLAVWCIWAVTVVQNGYYLWPGRFDLAESLPLQLCDLALPIAGLALGPGWRWARVLLYFWGLLLSSQGFITPTLESGMGHPRFWLFWVSHTLIIGAAVYDIVALGYRPTLRDLRLAAIVSAGYAAVVTLINVPLGLNYGFLGNSRPGNPTIVDSLGPWPLRVVWIATIGYTVQVLGWGAWALFRPRAGRDS